MEIFVSAGEASSDLHCGHLIRELKALTDHSSLSFFGLGGDLCASEGTSLLIHNREFSVGGGIFEVISKLPKRRKLERLLEERLYQKRPDGAILVDNGEINLRLASLLHFFQIPVVYFIPPKVWVWRHSRIEDLSAHVDLVLSILPFEEPIYKEWETPFLYVGNPLIDEVPLNLTQEKAKQELGISPNQPVLAVLPGSRHNEIRYQSKLFAKAIQLFLAKLPPGEPKPKVVIPIAPAIELAAVRALFEKEIPDVLCVQGMSHHCLKASRAALVKSGTSTLEAALLNVPMVLAYHSSKSAELLFKRVVRYKGFVGLVNLFLAKNSNAALGWDTPEKPVVPELILENCTPEKIADELNKIYLDGPEREKMLSLLSKTPKLLMPPNSLQKSPLKSAAAACLEVFRKNKNA